MKKVKKIQSKLNNQIIKIINYNNKTNKLKYNKNTSKI